MARPKKTTSKTKTTRATRTPKAKAQTGTGSIKLLSAIDKATASTKRPPNNPEVPQATIGRAECLTPESPSVANEIHARYSVYNMIAVSGQTFF